MANENNMIAQEEGLRRYRLIAPLLDEGLTDIEKQNVRWVIRCKEDVSDRTIRRYVAQYREGGFEALLPKERSDKGVSKVIPPEALELAVKYRKELPTRSAECIQQLLAAEGFEVSRSTLDRHLRRLGAAKKEMVKQQGISGRRFVREGRNVLWMSDIKYGPYIPDPQKPGKYMRTYLLVIIDDATRFVVHAEFYDNQKQPILEDSLRKAVLKCGVPSAIYVDNGKIFISHWMQLACARLRINHLRAPVMSAESKGKVERFNRTVEDSFMQEIKLQNPQTLAELNQYFRAWLSEGYNHKVHSSLKGKTPAQVFAEDAHPVRHVSSEALRDAFLWEKQAKVDKTGCAKLNGQVYEVGLEFCRQKVSLRYDPFVSDKAEIWKDSAKYREVYPVKPGPYNQKIDKTSETLEKASRSRTLELLAKNEQQRMRQHGLQLSEGVKPRV